MNPKQEFHKQLCWTFGGSSAYEIAKTLHTSALFFALTPCAFGRLGITLSLIYLIVHVSDAGLIYATALLPCGQMPVPRNLINRYHVVFWLVVCLVTGLFALFSSMV